MKNFGELARGFVNRVAERLREPQQPASAPNASSWPLRRNASSSAAAPTADVQQALSESAALPLAVRIGQFKDKLFANPIDLDALRKLAMHGIPDKDGLRAITWKLLLHYLPTDPGLWEQELADKRERYRAFCQELIIDPKAKDGTSSGSVSEAHTAAASAAAGEASSGSMPPASPSRQPLSSQDVTGEDHPLSLGPASRWAAYFQDSEVLAQIQRDVVRTHPR